MNETIMHTNLGTLLKNARAEQNLSRETVSEGLLKAEELRNLEEGGEYDFWLVRHLMSRLHILAFSPVFYLSTRDNALVNLETEIQCDLQFWRYEKAWELLQSFYKFCDKKNRFQMQIYYQLYATLKVRQKQISEKDQTIFREFMEQEMPDFEKHLFEEKLFSTDEFSLITAYCRFMENDAAKRLKKLHYVIYHFQRAFTSDTERLQPFYAEMILACAQCEYELEDYTNCVAQCAEGLKVTNYSRRCKAGGELYELMADAMAKMLEKEIETIQNKMLFGENDTKNEEVKRQAKAILENYMTANALYDTYYFGYRDGYKEKLDRKVLRWKTII